MTQPTAPRPVPGPYGPASGPASAADPGQGGTAAEPVPAGAAQPADDDARRPAPGGQAPEDRRSAGLAGLDGLPVSEHVAVFEAEHGRLQRELGTIDPR
ncbi:hypothetical protein [Blastococcus xanthinilyticus]|uniref:Uncharacterized protein n=1 Tax=Blastococcus xanthinilyticus TaxID=1564164 RepID=A0A5S5CPM7_9ACTN|nr:hypothetical protein [Blastococcus xanthinilyticus]TYP81983.1 hypothetical protein BD833_12133 [Blastococcus xanthinilyticus]